MTIRYQNCEYSVDTYTSFNDGLLNNTEVKCVYLAMFLSAYESNFNDTYKGTSMLSVKNILQSRQILLLLSLIHLTFSELIHIECCKQINEMSEFCLKVTIR